MLYHLFVPLANEYPIFHVFRYLTFRSGGAVLTALLFCFIFGPAIIRWLSRLQKRGQPIREDGPESHLVTKKGTPTMGGVMILTAVGVSTLLWADLRNSYIWTVLFVTFGMGTIGFLDDFLKLSRFSHRGLPGKLKLAGQIAISLIACLVVSHIAPDIRATHLAVPFFKSILIDLGWFYFAFTAVVIVGASNAVNLTDGLDGLAIVPVVIATGCYALIAYLAGNAVFANYLQIHGVPGAGELAVLCAAIVGAGLGFLWYNAQPAQVFMGDIGSLSLGGAIGAISVVTKHELVLAIIGGLFVIEAVAVMLQVGSFKLTGKRIFLMAPIHHHFEKKGWKESKIVVRFWILAIIFALAGLSTLKLR